MMQMQFHLSKSTGGFSEQSAIIWYQSRQEYGLSHIKRYHGAESSQQTPSPFKPLLVAEKRPAIQDCRGNNRTSSSIVMRAAK